MERFQISRIPTVSVSYLLICATLVVAFLILGISPSRRAMESRHEEIGRMQAQIEEQKVLQPVYKGLLDRLRNADSADAVISPKVALSLDQFDQVASTLGGIAAKYGFQLVTATPDVKAMAKESKFMAVNVVMRGDFLTFRKILLELVELPYVEHTEELLIQETSEGKEFKLKIWLAIDRAKGDVKT